MVTATLSRLTLQPSSEAQLVVTVLVPALRCTGIDALPHVSQLPVCGKVSLPAEEPFTDALSVRACDPPLAYRTCTAYSPSLGTPVTVVAAVLGLARGTEVALARRRRPGRVGGEMLARNGQRDRGVGRAERT